jgi:lysophospholipase L1-like esterase
VVSVLERPSGSCRAITTEVGRIQAVTSIRNWVFLGDSLTEGVGSQRVSHVTELVNQFRVELNRSTPPTSVHHLRLRSVDPSGFDRFVHFNLAGYLNTDPYNDCARAFCIWNLACEGQTIETDFGWLPLIASIKPELVIVFRGSLESIIRPAMALDGLWPTWVPRTWRTYSSMDPRCYFSSTPWRRIKQSTIDDLKQRTRLKLLKARPGKPLMDLDTLANHYLELVTRLQRFQARVLMLGLLPVGEYFPASAAYFDEVNQRLLDISAEAGADFFDWGAPLRSNGFHEMLYRDTFHPNRTGAKKLADILRSYLSSRLIV